MKSIGSPFVDKGKLRTFLKDPLLKSLRNYSTWQKSAKGNDGASDRALPFQGTYV
jgi:hypothetical protein